MGDDALMMTSSTQLGTKPQISSFPDSGDEENHHIRKICGKQFCRPPKVTEGIEVQIEC